MDGRTLRNVAVGAAVSLVASFVVPFVGMGVGGGVAGYLQRTTARDGARVGALSGAIVTVPVVLYALAGLWYLGFGFPWAAELLVVALLAAVGVGLAALGGYLGAYVALDTAQTKGGSAV